MNSNLPSVNKRLDDLESSVNKEFDDLDGSLTTSFRDVKNKLKDLSTVDTTLDNKLLQVEARQVIKNESLNTKLSWCLFGVGMSTALSLVNLFIMLFK